MSANNPPALVLDELRTSLASGPATLGVSLDIARGLAALLVFCFHISGYIAQISPTLGALARYGYMGVPIFFVISGYCMAASAHQVLRRNRPAGSFLRKRFLRIYPAFWASIVVIMATPYILAGLSALKTGNFISPAPRWLALDSLDWLQLVTLTRVFFSNGLGLDHAFSPLNIVYWTLAIEFQFYLVIYLALLWRKWFVVILACVTLSSLAVFAYPALKETGLFLGYWPMFAMGLGLYCLLDRNYTLRRLGGGVGKWLPIPLLSISLVAFAMLAYHGLLVQVLESLFSNDAFGFAVCTGIAFWLLSNLEQQISFQATNGHAFVRLPLKVGVFLGSISYSVYLLHSKIYQFPEIAIRQLTTPDNPIYTLTLIGGTVGLSWLFYLYFERPFISRRPII
jgi:peptidoglycan/LPS O-acetylase OafA/YrhL